MKHTLMMAGCLALSFAATTAQAIEIKARQKYLDNYNVQRALEVIEENPREAYQYLDRETDEHPENGYAWCLMGQLFASIGNYGTALDYSTKAIDCLTNIQLDPEWLSVSYVLRAAAYQVLGHDDLRLKDLNLAVKHGKLISIGSGKVDDRSAYSARAEYYREKHQYALADADFRKLQEADPDRAYPLMGLGRDAMDMGHYEQAADYFRQAAAVDPDDASYHNCLAEALYCQGRYGESCDELVASLIAPYTDFTPDLSLAVDSLAPVAADTLLSRIDQALKHPEQEATLAYVAATCLSHVCRYDEALPYMLRAAESDESSSSYYVFAGSIARHQGQDSLALAYNMQGYERDSSDFEICAYIAATLCDLGRYNESEQWNLRAIEERPDQPFCYERLAWTYICQQRFAEALEQNELAFLLDPEDPSILYQRSLLLSALDREDALRHNAEAALTIDTLRTGECTRAFQLMFLGREDEALAEVDLCLTERPYNRADILVNKAEILVLAGKTDEAQAVLVEAKQAGYRRFHSRRRVYPFCDHPEIFDNL